MPSDSVAGFLDRAQANRVLFPEQVEQLIRQPDIPHSDLNSLCEYLLSRGVLTRFQAAAIRDSRGRELTFAGYPVIDEIGPCPGGTAYKALHPSLRTPLVLRRIRPDWLRPADTVENYLQRARTIGMLIHANIVPLLDAGIENNELYLVIDYPPDTASVEVLAAEVGGAMPGFLAAEYARVLASALRMAHDRGGVHGDVRPGNLVVGPLTTKKSSDGSERRRPAPNAIVRLTELGLVPHRPLATQYPPDRAAAPYLSPERLDSSALDPRGDIYGLGASLYFLLAGRAPFEGSNTEEVLARVRSQEPTSLAALRPDLPAELVSLVARMMDKNLQRRPATASEVEAALSPFCRRGSAAPATVAVAVPAPAAAEVVAIPVSEAAPAAEPEPENPWASGAAELSSAHSEAPAKPRVRGMSEAEKKRSRLLMVFGALMHITGVSLFLIFVWPGCFNSAPKPDPDPPKKEREHAPPKKKGKSQAL